MTTVGHLSHACTGEHWRDFEGVPVSTLFSVFRLGRMSLPNRTVMSPMTRCRAIAGTGLPTPIMADYYAQRADAGLLVTEGTAPSADGLGYARTPGVYNAEQAKAWRLVTDAVHAKGGRIVVQLMDVGRMGHPLNQPAGARLRAPSAIGAPGTMWTDAQQNQPMPVPAEMTEADIEAAITGFVTSARLAVGEAGFDGIELHGANGYLIEQFLNTASNQRTDRWGGSVENRIRFAVEVATRVSAAIGADRVGIRLSPYGGAGGMITDAHTDAVYTALAAALSGLGLLYIHVVDHSAMGAPPVPQAIKDTLRATFRGPVIAAGGFDADRAESVLAAGGADLVAFGRPFLANPSLVTKLRTGAALNSPDFATFYAPGVQGYLDYPV
jgi:N-ethylmaleimide reductase